jgi:hypothetical protein
MGEWIDYKQDSDRHCLLAGPWDPATGNSWRTDFEVNLRWWALFYKHIIVPDSYFCCYGPLYKRLSSSKIDLYGSSDTDDLILRLLQAGVIIVGVIDGETRPGIYGRWPTQARGGHRQLHMTLTRDDGERYLKQLNYSVKYCVKRPADDPRQILAYGNAPSRFHELVDAIIMSPGGFLDIYDQELKGKPPISSRDKNVVERMHDSLRGTLAKKGKYLRRRDLEMAIFDSMASIFPALRFRDLYDLRPKTRWANVNPPMATRARDILAGIATVYQVRESWRWNTVGCFLPDYSPALVEAMHQQENAKHCALKHKTFEWFGNQLDLRELSVDRLLKFRESSLFKTYLAELIQVQAPNPSESFVHKNHTFLTFLEEDYMPAIRSLAERPRISTRAEKAKKYTESVTKTVAGSALGTVGQFLTTRLAPHWQLIDTPLGWSIFIGGGIVIFLVAPTVISLPMGTTAERLAKAILQGRLQHGENKQRNSPGHFWRRVKK